MLTVKGTETEVVLRSFQERLKNTLENTQGPRREGEKPIADLLFQFIKEVTGHIDIAVMHVDKLRLGSGSPSSAKKRFSLSPLKVVSILGEINGVLYCCRKGELCQPYHDNTLPPSAYPQVRVIPRDNIPEKLALALIEEIMKGLESFMYSGNEPVPEPCNGFVIKYSVRSSDGSMKKWKFTFMEKSKEVQNYEQATAVFSSRYKKDAAQKKLQMMGDIMIYAGKWISIEKSLSQKFSVMDSRIAGFTPTELVVSEQSATV